MPSGFLAASTPPFAARPARARSVIAAVRGRLLAAGLGATALVAGCAPSVEGIRGPVPVPNTYAFAASVQPAKVSRWWARFGSPELDRLVETANFANLDIAIAVSQLREADAQAQIAAAALFPTLTYNDNNVRTQSSGTNVPGVVTRPALRSSFTKVINASYVLDVWGQNRDALEAAIRTATASAYQIEVVRLTAIASLVNNYLIYAANRQRVAVGMQNLANAERILTAIRQRRAAGTASELDEVQQQALVESQRAALALLRQGADAARVLVASLLGTNPQAVPLSVRSVRSLKVPVTSPGLPAAILVRRPDVRSQEQQLLAADANVEVARKAFLPNIQLTGQAGYQSSALATLLRPESVIWQAAASLTQPIFDGGRLRGQLTLSEAQRQQLLDTYRRSIITALSDVETALVAVRETRLRELAQTAAVRAARRAFELSEQRLREGTVDLTSILSVQNTLFQAEDVLIQVRLARLQAAVSLFQALGGDWDESMITVSGIP